MRPRRCRKVCANRFEAPACNPRREAQLIMQGNLMCGWRPPRHVIFSAIPWVLPGHRPRRQDKRPSARRFCNFPSPCCQRRTSCSPPGQEVGTKSYFVHEVPSDAGTRTLSFNAAHLRRITASRKTTDRHDAHRIARARASGTYPLAVYVPLFRCAAGGVPIDAHGRSAGSESLRVRRTLAWCALHSTT